MFASAGGRGKGTGSRRGDDGGRRRKRSVGRRERGDTGVSVRAVGPRRVRGQRRIDERMGKVRT